MTIMGWIDSEMAVADSAAGKLGVLGFLAQTKADLLDADAWGRIVAY